MKKWIKILLVILAVAALSVGIYFTLRALGVTSIEGIREIIAKCGALGWIVFIALFILCSTLLCFIPGTSATFIAVSIILFRALEGFIISTISVFLSSSLMFVIGNTLGEKAAVKLVGKDSLEKAQKLLDMKSKMLLPLMFLFPIFPDDALCLVAGMTKMRYWYFAIVAAVFRTVGIGTICFLGGGLIDWSLLSLVDWFVLINVCLIDIFFIFKYQHKIEQLVLHRKKKKPEAKENPRIKNLIQKQKEFDNAIKVYQDRITQKKYTSEKQKKDIEIKILKVKEAKRRLEINLKKELDYAGLSAKNPKQQIQELVCNQIKKVMEQEFPTVTYSFKLSNTTASVYLTLVNDKDVTKTIRFSDHNTYKNCSKYKIDNITSYKKIKTIIESNLKALSKKTVYVLLDKIEKDGAK